jgi:hypothetical protein
MKLDIVLLVVLIALVWGAAAVAVRILYSMLDVPECVGRVCVYGPPISSTSVAVLATIITVGVMWWLWTKRTKRV